MKQLLWCAAILLSLLREGNTAEYALPQKKLIDAGWGFRSTSDLVKYRDDIEKTAYSGVVLGVAGEDDEKKEVKFSTHTFSARPWKKAWFQKNLQDLKKFHSTKLTDNFLIIGSNTTPEFDWDDDAAWKQVVEHWKMAAWLAKKGNLRGIAFDPEMYEGNLFDFRARPGTKKYSFQEYEFMARRRGAQIFSEIAKIYPDMVLFTFWMNEINRPVDNKHFATRIRQTDNLELSASYNLYPAFINGWLDSAPASMTFVDGCETGYGFDKPSQFLEAAQWVRNTGLYLVAPENRAKYRAQVQVGFALYLDSYSDQYKPGERWAQAPLHGSLQERLRSNLDSALRVTDQYVWLWGERHRWWGADIQTTHWENILPGITRIVHDAVQPNSRDENLQGQFSAFIESEKLPNIITNGDFSAVGVAVKPENKDRVPVGWTAYQDPKQAQGQIAYLPAKDGGAADSKDAGVVMVSGAGHGLISQAVQVKPGKRYFIRCRAANRGQGMSVLELNWKDAADKWVHYEANLTLTDSRYAPANEYTDISAVVVAPDEAFQMIVMAGARGQKNTSDRVSIKSLEVYPVESEKWPAHYQTGTELGVTYPLLPETE